MKINLIAVQPKMELAHYKSAGAFEAKIVSLMEAAVRRVDLSLPTLVAFPEYLGMYLSFVPRYWEEVRSATTLRAAVDRIVAGHAPNQAGRTSKRKTAQRLLFVERAIETERAYTGAFSSLARQHGVYIVAGSLCVPPMDESPHRGGHFIQDGSRVLGRSYVFSPAGLCIHRVSKVNIPEGEDRLIDPAPVNDLAPVAAKMGRIGVLLCFDGYHHSLIGRLDSQGADILVQPLYFPNPDIRFDGSGKFVPKPWDFISLIQGRENIQYGIAAAQVGAVFEDQRAQGLSFIARNTGKPGLPWQEAIVAMAEEPYGETIVAATVDTARR